MSGGPALKQAIHVARARTDMTSDVQLAERAPVSYDTLMNWFGGRTVPRPAELKRVADALGVSYGDLMAVYEGRAEPPPLQDVIRELVAVLRPLVEQATDGIEMRLRAAEAELESLRAARAAEGSPAQSSPAGTTV